MVKNISFKTVKNLINVLLKTALFICIYVLFIKNHYCKPISNCYIKLHHLYFNHFKILFKKLWKIEFLKLNLFIIIFLFPFSIKNTTITNYKNVLYIGKMKRVKCNPQPKTEPLPNLQLAIPRQELNTKGLIFEHHSEVIVLSLKKGKGKWYF